MPRRLHFEVTCQTTHFSPLQPRTLADWSFAAWCRWIRALLVSFRQLLDTHHTSVVAVGFRLHYLRPYDWKKVGPARDA